MIRVTVTAKNGIFDAGISYSRICDAGEKLRTSQELVAEMRSNYPTRTISVRVEKI